MLFLIYINDFHKSISNPNAIHFADDTTLYKEIEPSFDTINLITEELTQVQLWINANRLLNVEQTKFMILPKRANKEDLSLTLNGNNISRVTFHNFQGVLIDEILKFKVHINKVCTKVSQSIGVIRRVSNMVLDNVLHSLYYALAYSRITCAICAWRSAHPTALKSLKSLVKKNNINEEYSSEQTSSFFSSI